MYIEKKPKLPKQKRLIEIVPEIYVNFKNENPEILFIDLGLGFFIELKHQEIVNFLPDTISLNEKRLLKNENDLKEIFIYKNKFLESLKSLDNINNKI